MFHYLHWHSHFSLLRAIWSPKQLIWQAQSYGLQSLALTDYDSMYGAVEFYQWCKKAGIKPIIWVQINIVNDLSKSSNQQLSHQITLIAINQAWYHQLMNLVSDAHTIAFFEWPRIDISMIQSRIQDCIVTFWWPRSCFKTSYNTEWISTVSTRCTKLKQILGPNRVYIEHIIQDYNIEPEIQLINEFATGIAHQLDVPIICNPDYHYILAEDKEIYEVALCIRDWQTLFDRQRKKIAWNYCLMSPWQITDIMDKQWLSTHEIETLFSHNKAVSDYCDIQIDLWSLHFPQYCASDEIQAQYNLYQNMYMWQ